MAKAVDGKIAKFKPQTRNGNKHTQRGMGMLEASMRQYGYVSPMTAAADGEIIDGSARIETSANVFGDDAIVVHHDGTKPIIMVRDDIPSADTPEARAISMAANRIAQVNLDFDAEVILADLQAGVDLAQFWRKDELDELLADLQPKTTGDTPAEVDRAEELRQKWGVKSGDLWSLGDHKLVCGDCTDPATVARVMGNDKAEMVWTDPPYGVGVGDKNKFLNSIAPSNRIEENLQNDTLDEPALMAMLCAAFDNAMAHCTAGAAWYVAAPPGPLHVLFGQALKDRGIWRQTLQWVKNNSTFSPMGVCYHWQAEPIFFGWLPNGAHRWYGGRTQTTVWNIDRPMASPEHPTMKPVELVARAIENSSQPSEVVLEPFNGSGTTIIACQNLSRRCRAVEISPAYVAVALERWSVHTGHQPVLVDI